MITPKELCWMSLKEDGHFKDYKNYEEYQHRNDKKKEPVRVIKESRSEEIQRLKANYNPKSTVEFNKLKVVT